MLYSDEFLNLLPEDPVLALSRVIEQFFNEPGDEYEQYIEFYCALEAMVPSVPVEVNFPKLSRDEGRNREIILDLGRFIRDELGKVRKQAELEFLNEKYSSKFKRRFHVGFIYQFTEGDLTRIQNLLNELRESITASELFEESHKQRILKKLENLQSELHKKMANLDKFWGLIGDAGIVIGKFGKDAKPFVDRIKEVAQIVWRTQAKAEELPSGASLPLLKDTEEDK